MEELAALVAHDRLAAETGDGAGKVAFLIAPHHEHEAFDDPAIAYGQRIERELVIGRETLEQGPIDIRR